MLLLLLLHIAAGIGRSASVLLYYSTIEFTIADIMFIFIQYAEYEENLNP